MEVSPFFIGDTTSKGPFSIAMLVYRSVSKFSQKTWTKKSKVIYSSPSPKPKAIYSLFGREFAWFFFPPLSHLKRLNQSKSCKTSVPFVCFFFLETTKCQNNTLRTMNHKILVSLVVEPTHLKNMSQLMEIFQIGVNKINVWNQHLDIHLNLGYEP